MRFYGNQFGSSYEELISYYPRYYRNVLEMVAILNAQGKLLDDAKAQIEQKLPEQLHRIHGRSCHFRP